MSKNRTYSIQITDEQIKLIRSFSLRAEQLYTHRSMAELVLEDGIVKCTPYWRCYFCDKASYANADSIPHGKNCIIPLAEKEFDALNAQFIEAEHKE